MKFIKIVLGAVLFLVVLMLVFPLLYPLNLYIPQLQKSLSTLLRLPVQIGEISVAYMPFPQVVLGNVRIGPERQAEIARVVVAPDYLSWLGGGKRIKNLTLEDASVSQAFVLLGPDLIKGMQQDQHYLVRQMMFNNARVRMTRATFGPFNAQLNISKQGQFQQFLLSQEGQAATLGIEPYEGGKYKYSFDTQGWAIPGAEDLRFSSLTIIGIGNSDAIDFNDIRGVLYGGTLTGSARLFFNDQWRLLGKYRLNNLQAEPLTLAVSPHTNASGRIVADGSFVASGRYLEDIPSRPQTQVRVSVHDGSVNNFDLITAIRYNSPSGEGLRGGKTRFDDMTLTLDVRDHSLRFSAISLQSGLLTATGNVVLNSKAQWNGNLQVRLKSPVNPLAMSLGVSGALDTPLLQPHAAAPIVPVVENEN